MMTMRIIRPRQVRKTSQSGTRRQKTHADLDEEGSCSQRATLTPHPEPGEDKVLQSNPTKLALAFLLGRMLFLGWSASISTNGQKCVF